MFDKNEFALGLAAQQAGASRARRQITVTNEDVAKILRRGLTLLHALECASVRTDSDARRMTTSSTTGPATCLRMRRGRRVYPSLATRMNWSTGSFACPLECGFWLDECFGICNDLAEFPKADVAERTTAAERLTIALQHLEVAMNLRVPAGNQMKPAETALARDETNVIPAGTAPDASAKTPKAAKQTKRPRGRRTKVEAEQLRERVHRLKDDQLSNTEIASKLGIGDNYVSEILAGHYGEPD